MAAKAKTHYVVGNVAFVPHPVGGGFWLKTDRAVVLVACPNCRSPAGSLCLGASGQPVGYTHVDRRDVARRVTLPRRPTIIIAEKP